MKIRGAVLEETTVKRPFVSTQPLAICDIELEPPRSGEVLVRMEAAGLCHSDVSVITGDRPRPLPMLLGHEACGEVVEIGQGVKRVSVGDKVVMSFLPQCGDCSACVKGGGTPCLPGSASNGAGELLGGGRRLKHEERQVNHHLGVSAFASYAVVSEYSVVPVDSDIPPTVGALLGCAVLTGAGAVFNVAQPQAGESLTVVGLGGVGMAAVLAGLYLSDVSVTAVDVSEERLQYARELGVTDALQPEEALDRGHHSTYVVEAAGSVRAFETSISLTVPGGVTVAVGLPNPTLKAELSVVDLVAQNRTLRGSYMGSSNPLTDIRRYIDFWRTGRFPIEALVTSTLGLDDINFGMDQLADAKGIRQVVLL